MNSDLRARLRASLLLPFFVYLLLPLFGPVWHSVVPEHDHMLAAGANAAEMIDLTGHSHAGGAACDLCSSATLAPFATVIHAYDPVSALQIFGIMLGLVSLFVLIAPHSLSSPVYFPPLFLKSASLVSLELPPAT